MFVEDTGDEPLTAEAMREMLESRAYRLIGRNLQAAIAMEMERLSTATDPGEFRNIQGIVRGLKIALVEIPNRLIAELKKKPCQ